MSKRFLVLTVAALCVGLTATAAFAAKPGIPVEFTIAAGQCPQLGPDVAVFGEGIINTVQHHNSLTQFASGSAVDTNGTTYKFNYNLTVSELTNRTILTDHFNLVGSSGEKIHATFTLRFDENGVFLNQHGDAIDPVTLEGVCDPL